MRYISVISAVAVLVGAVASAGDCEICVMARWTFCGLECQSIDGQHVKGQDSSGNNLYEDHSAFDWQAVSAPRCNGTNDRLRCHQSGNVKCATVSYYLFNDCTLVLATEDLMTAGCNDTTSMPSTVNCP